MRNKDTRNVVIIGHVDHGKSTLIGRMLFDTRSIPKDRVDAIKVASRKGGADLNFAFFTDQFQEEREKSMTMDTSQVRFSTAFRNYVIIDSPGHVEFTKNMITGATHADFGILVVSAVDGLEEQTKRHASILNMLGIKTLTLFINKMDLSDYDEGRFNHVAQETADFLRRIGTELLCVIPGSAMKGDNVAKRSKNMKWYKGPTLLADLDKLKEGNSLDKKPLRFPVQDVYLIDNEKVFVGRVESGRLSKGDNISIFPAWERTTIKDIKIFPAMERTAYEGENIGITLPEGKGVSAGNVLLPLDGPTLSQRSFSADIFCLAASPMRMEESFAFRCGPQETECVIEKIEKRIDSSTFEVLEEMAGSIGPNEIGRVKLTCSKSVIVENFTFIPGLGRFVLENDIGVCAVGVVR